MRGRTALLAKTLLLQGRTVPVAKRGVEDAAPYEVLSANAV